MAAKRYTMLHKGQLVKAGDEYFSTSDNTWQETLNASGNFHVGDRGSVLEYRRPMKAAVAAKTSLNKRSAAPKTPPKSAKRRLRTAS